MIPIAGAQVRCPQDKRADDLATRFVIKAGTIRLPIGAFLLVRKGARIGAIRLTGIDPAATQETGKSTWESLVEPDRSGSFVAKGVVRQTGELNIQPLQGPGRLIYIHQPGVIDARVGKWKFSFDAPSLMTMSDTSFWTGTGDHGFEFAPTAACDASEINIRDEHLRWFRYDRNADTALPLSDLPK
jgi:hypothetical protein